MHVLTKDAAEAVTPVDVQPAELIRVGDRARQPVPRQNCSHMV
jgi:hypothetical protein